MTAPADYRRRAQLSWRVRAYVGVLALRHIGFAAALMWDSRQLERSATFRYVFDLAGPTTWAWIFLAVGLAALGGLVNPKEKGIRGLVVLSVGLSCAWASGTALAALVAPPAPSGLAIVAFISFALKDLIVAGMVYVNPLEHAARHELRRGLP